MGRLMEMVEEFQKALGIEATKERMALQPRLLDEEYLEVQEALVAGSRRQIAKELADLVYVAVGTARVYNIDLDRVLEEVHQSNMSKLGPDGKGIKRADGKFVKGPGYRAPRLSDINWRGRDREDDLPGGEE